MNISLLRAARIRSRRRLPPLLALLAIAGAGAAAAVEPGAASPWVPQGGFVQFGHSQNVEALTAGLLWPWRRDWALLGGRLGGYWEVSLSRWRVDEPWPQQSRWLNQLAVTPVFRWRPQRGESPWFVEAGVGLTYLDETYLENDGQRFSTRWNFGDHLALGRSFGPGAAHELALRVQHFSNGGVRHPNPGEDFVQLRYAWRFR